jgi:hypothetical protein
VQYDETITKTRKVKRVYVLLLGCYSERVKVMTRSKDLLAAQGGVGKNARGPGGGIGF